MEILAKVFREHLKNPIQAAILWKLKTGRAYTVVELANHSKTSKPEIKGQLSELLQAGLLVEVVRRKRAYYRILDEKVAGKLLDQIEGTKVDKIKQKREPQPAGMKYCRTCYHHLAGRVGVLLTGQLLRKNYIKIENDGHFHLTPEGETFFEDFEIDTESLRQKRSLFAKACIDFSERKYHLGGALGNAFFDKMLEKDWANRVENSREIKFTLIGKKAFAALFQIEV